MLHPQGAALTDDFGNIFERLDAESVFELLGGVGLTRRRGHIHVVLDSAAVEIAVQFDVKFAIVVADNGSVGDDCRVVAGLHFADRRGQSSGWDGDFGGFGGCSAHNWMISIGWMRVGLQDAPPDGC